MKYPITEYDKELLLQSIMQYKLKISVTDKKRNVIDVLTGISEVGGIHIDADSNIRRTFSFTLKPDDFIDNIEAKIAGWMGLYYEIEIGLLDQRTNTFAYYPCGRFCITTASTSYDASSNSITFELSDRISELDGTRNGQIGGAPAITIPKENGGKKQTIREITVNLVNSSTGIDRHIIDDIGEFNGMPQNNPDYADYRLKNDEWNVLPYDLEYSSGTYMSDILFDIRDLYPNCQMYFDVYDNFCFDMIPSLDNDLPDLDNDFLQRLLVSSNTEAVSYDIPSIKNITEIFGKSYDVDRYAESCTYSGNTYHIPLSDYPSYGKYDIIALKPSGSSLFSPSLKINSLSPIPIYYQYTSTPLKAGELQAGKMCVFQIYRISDKYMAYYLGQYQPHVLCVLTGNLNDSKYTPKYFAGKYNVEEKNVYLRNEPFSNFSVQKQGEILDSKCGDEFDNILSDSVALENAKYYNRLSSTMFDTVTITTKLIPWLDVNVKVNYKKAQEDTVYSYVVKSRQDDFMSGTSTITMYRFLQLYEQKGSNT